MEYTELTTPGDQARPAEHFPNTDVLADIFGLEPIIDDEALTVGINTALAKVSPLDSHRVWAESFGDVVQLSGFVSSHADLALALEIASGVDGVTAVRNCLRVL